MFAGNFSQAANAVQSYTADLTKDLNGDTLSSVEWSAAPSGLSVIPTTPAFTGNVIGVWISDGIPDQYQANGLAYTVGGRQIPVVFNFLITPGNFMNSNYGVRTVTAAGSFQMQTGDNIIEINPSPAGVCSILTPAVPIIGKPYKIKDISSAVQANPATIIPAAKPDASPGSIDGLPSLTLNQNLGSVTFYADANYNLWTIT